METKILILILALSERRAAESENRIKGFERINARLSVEVDRQRKEIEILNQRAYKNFNLLELAA